MFSSSAFAYLSDILAYLYVCINERAVRYSACSLRRTSRRAWKPSWTFLGSLPRQRWSDNRLCSPSDSSPRSNRFSAPFPLLYGRASVQRSLRSFVAPFGLLASFSWCLPCSCAASSHLDTITIERCLFAHSCVALTLSGYRSNNDPLFVRIARVKIDGERPDVPIAASGSGHPHRGRRTDEGG